MKIKRKTFFAGVILIIIFLCNGTSFSVFPGKTIEFEGGGEGKVIFSGLNHRGKHKGCADCHPDIFPMRMGIKMTMAEMKAGKYCGACHNGKEAFSVQECNKCHKK
jgi:c(7)-type cytochrome triheme protein